jgi:hypothetical protein
MTDIAIVILNWNTKKYLEKFLPVLIENSNIPGVEIYVADNGSTDDSVVFLKKKHPEIHRIELPENYGFTGGYNKALAQIEAKYYLLLNSDIEVTPNWLKPLKELMDNNEQIGACMPKIRSYHKPEFFEYAGAAGGYIDKYGYPFCRGRIMDVLEEDRGQYNNETEIFWATGACMMVRADIYHQLGGLDDDFFAHMEEIDLCWRIQNAGYKVMYTHRSMVFHIGGGSLSTDSPFKLFLNFRNNLYLLYKNLPKKKLFPVLTQRMLLDMFSALVYLLKGSPKKSSAVFKAHCAFLKNKQKLKEKRRTQPALNKTPRQMVKKSMLYEFFIRKKIYFRQLLYN